MFNLFKIQMKMEAYDNYIRTIRKLVVTKSTHLIERVEKINNKDPLEDRWLDIQDVCELLHISKRTLQSYRDKGILPFSQIGAKIYYKSSDIQKHLEKHYNPAF